MKYSCINIQGNLITEEILQKIEDGSAEGQANSFFGLDSSSNLRSEVEYAWSRIRLDWKHFNERSQNLPASDPYGTTITRRWMENILNALGFSLARQRTSLEGGNEKTYAISHTAQNLDDLPIHIVGFTDPNRPEKNTIDMRSSGGTSRLSPHSTVQEYLNVTDHLYGIAANGWNLRLIRDSGRLVKLTYLEFDLKRMLDEDKYSEFTLLFRLMHATRFPHSKEETGQSLLEKYYQQSIETGNRIRDGLSLAVQESLVALGNGFLQSVENDELRNRIRSGNLSTTDFYRQIRRLVYRLLFLMVMEERYLVYDPDDRDARTTQKKSVYLAHYSIARLRSLSAKRYLHEEGYTDLWQGLLNTFSLFEAGGKGKKLAISPLSGDLFSSTALKDIESCKISNKLLLECMRKLNEFDDKDDNNVQVNYRALDVEELGSVYEGLLELHPVIENIESDNPSTIQFLFHEGTERKTTGSYYTRPELVNELIKSALIPVIEERLAATAPSKSPPSGGGFKSPQEDALLSIKVCDPAAGSGHFLLAASRTIAWYLARVRSGEENPPPSVYHSSLREVIQHCIYGVDLNPDAVELCKLALWLESHNSGKPLSFLDHKIRCGNSLVGVTDLKVLTEPLPDEAFNPVTGDDPAVCKELKKRNKAYAKTRQSDLFSSTEQKISADNDQVNSEYSAIDHIRQDTLESIEEIKKRYGSARASLFQEERACNIWTSAFFHTYTSIDDPSNPDSEKLAQFFLAPTQYGRLVGKTTGLSSQYHFFHWPIEFPDVFAQGGFDVMLGNPPWEKIKLEEQQFFATKSISVAKAKNKFERSKLIKQLPLINPELWNEYQVAIHEAEAGSKFIRFSKRFQLSAKGDINTYLVFTELFYRNKNVKSGRIGIIIPIGIVAENSSRFFFEHLVLTNSIESFYGFVNTKKIFSAIKDYIKFGLLTLGLSNTPKFCFWLTDVVQIGDPERIFTITKDEINLINPNTNTCPLFRTNRDAFLTKKIFSKIEILNRENSDIIGWGSTFNTLYHMSNDSGEFKEVYQSGLLPLYEAKMIWNYDHRFSTYENASQANINEGNLPQFTPQMHADCNNSIVPRYYIDKESLTNRLGTWQKKWFFAFRGIAATNNERTFIYSIIPFVGAGNSSPVIVFPDSISTILLTCFLANANSLIYDYLGRQKAVGSNLNFYIIKQMAVIQPNQYQPTEIKNIVIKAIELIYTSWDIKAFADDLWQESDNVLKNTIIQQAMSNYEATGGHDWSPPDWAEQPATPNEPGYSGCPLPPFKWDEERRAVLKAELDAIYAKFYGLTTDELRYILDPQDVYGPDFPGETFRVLKEKENRLYGEYRTKRLVMEAWGKLGKSQSDSIIH